MKHIIYYGTLCATILITSCSKGSKENVINPNSTEQESIENLNIQTKQFTEIDSTGILIFPLNMGETLIKDGLPSSSYSYKKIPDNEYWNILFLNSNTNEYNLLTENKILILDYNYKYGKEEGYSIAKKNNHIFYNVRTEDFNGNKILEEQDPIYLFVSDKFGKNFRQISPKQYSVNHWQFIEGNNKIILTATKDSNNNKTFDEKDEVSTFQIILDKEETPKEVFQSEIKTKLKFLYDKDWKKIKK